MEASQENNVKRHQKQQLSFNSLQVVLAVGMVAVGAMYKNDCNMGAAMFLMAGGGIMLFINLFSLFALATPCECDDIFMKALAPVIGLIQMCVFLAGTIVVFGWYSSWSYDLEDKGKDGYCAYPPFMFAFVLLIIEWIVMPLFICGVCCMICGSAWTRNELNH